jgi:hypothetical protein
VVTRLNYGTTNSLNYSETLYEWSLGALITEGKLQIEHKNDKEETIIFIPGETPLSSNNNVAKSFNVAMDKYFKALEFLKIPSAGRKEYVQHNIAKLCFEINQLIFPIALSEGLLDLKDVMNNAMGGQGGLTVGRED